MYVNQCYTTMKRNISINFVVRESKIRVDGTAPIQVCLCLNSNRASFCTGKAVKPENWDRKAQKVKGRDEVTLELNRYLESIKA